VAGDSNVVLGDSPFNFNQQINILKAKELAEAVLAAARDNVAREEEAAKKEKEKEKEKDKKEEKLQQSRSEVEIEEDPTFTEVDLESPLCSLEREAESDRSSTYSTAHKDSNPRGGGNSLRRRRKVVIKKARVVG
jgi:hypothetical protein